MGDAEPYLWTVFFKIDGDSVQLTDSLKLAGTATVRRTPGSHGNLNTSGVDAGATVAIPDSLGDWNPFLTPIPVPDSLQPIVGDDLGGVVGVVCVLMEEDNVSDDGAEAGHDALNAAVQTALDGIIATRSFSSPDITDAEINAYLADIASAVSNAVQNEQNFFENLWSFLNKDDQIGSRVFFFKHDDLAGGGIMEFSQRWQNEGDWELFGHVNASVACPARAVGTVNEALHGAFEKSAPAMRSFRDDAFGAESALGGWWSVAERNAPQLLFALSKNEALTSVAGGLLEGIAGTLRDLDRELPDEHLKAVERIVSSLQQVGGRRTRLDASRVSAIVPHLRGKKGSQAIELLSSVAPGRHPRPSKDVSGLLISELHPPRSVMVSPLRSGKARSEGE